MGKQLVCKALKACGSSSSEGALAPPSCSLSEHDQAAPAVLDAQRARRLALGLGGPDAHEDLDAL